MVTRSICMGGIRGYDRAAGPCPRGGITDGLKEEPEDLALLPAIFGD